jgi:hypothetical protein
MGIITITMIATDSRHWPDVVTTGPVRVSDRLGVSDENTYKTGLVPFHPTSISSQLSLRQPGFGGFSAGSSFGGWGNFVTFLRIGSKTTISRSLKAMGPRNDDLIPVPDVVEQPPGRQRVSW